MEWYLVALGFCPEPSGPIRTEPTLRGISYCPVIGEEPIGSAFKMNRFGHRLGSVLYSRMDNRKFNLIYLILIRTNLSATNLKSLTA